MKKSTQNKSVDDRACVLYIPGLFSRDNPQSEAKKLLRRIYPSRKYKVELFPWQCVSINDSESLSASARTDWQAIAKSSILSKVTSFFCKSNVFNCLLMTVLMNWHEERINAEKAARKLAETIASMPASKRERMVLIGHSLGAYIVVKALASLAGRHMKISHAVLLGAAVPHNDKSILAACRATINPIDYTVNHFDWALGLYSIVNFHCPLGLAGYSKTKTSKMRAIKMSKISHSSEYYIRQYAKDKNISIPEPKEQSSFSIPVGDTVGMVAGTVAGGVAGAIIGGPFLGAILGGMIGCIVKKLVNAFITPKYDPGLEPGY